MADKWYNYAAVAAGTVLANASTANPALIGATQAIASNGSLVIVADAPTGQTNCLGGTTQGVSGTSYLTETLAAAQSVVSFSWYFKITAALTLSPAQLFFANGGTRNFAIGFLSTNQFRIYNAANGTQFTSTISDNVGASGFEPNVWYRLSGWMQVGTGTGDGVINCRLFRGHGTTPIANGTHSSVTANMGTLQVTTIRHGPRSSTGTADDTIRQRVGYGNASGEMGPQVTSAAPVLVRTIDLLVAVIDARTSQPGQGGVLSYTCSPAAIAESPVGRFFVARDPALAIEYTITVAETGSALTTNTPKATISQPTTAGNAYSIRVGNGASFV